jgi:biotin-(acetyl-CoA carboxylase) ligase
MNKNLTENQKAKIDKFAEIKKQCDILTKTVEKEKEALLAELGVGIYVTDKNILSFSEQERRTTRWKQIAEENIEPALLNELVANNTNLTNFVMCRVTEACKSDANETID